MKREIVKLLGIGLATSCALWSSIASASIIFPLDFMRVATINTVGAYDNAQLGTWNGQPISASNHPSIFEDELSATWNFYVDPENHSRMLIVVGDICDTNFGFINGNPFNLVALTGFTFSMKLAQGGSDPTFSDQFAVSGEALLGPVSGSSVPLFTTSGWSVTGASGVPDQRHYSLDAANTNSAFTHFPSVFGATRIFGGGVFGLTYDQGVDLLRDADFATLRLDASNGSGAYQEQGTLTFAYVPEPLTWALMVFGFGFSGSVMRRQRSALPQ